MGAAKIGPSGLTPVEAKFVMEYAEGGTITAAAERAGYSMKCAAVLGSRALKKPRVQAALAARLNDIAVARGITPEAIAARMLREADDRGDDASHGARVSAIAHLGRWGGLDAQQQAPQGNVVIRIMVGDTNEQPKTIDVTPIEP